MKVFLFFAFLIFKIPCLYKRRVLPKSLSSCVIHSISYSSKTEYFYFSGFRDYEKYFQTHVQIYKVYIVTICN